MEKTWEVPQILAEFNPNAMSVNDVLGDWGEWIEGWLDGWRETT